MKYIGEVDVILEIWIKNASKEPWHNLITLKKFLGSSVVRFFSNKHSHGCKCISLKKQLDIYIDSVRGYERFANLKHLGDLSWLMVETKKLLSQTLVYWLLKLSLILHVATATVERCFSGIKTVKTVLRNRICDQFLSDCIICFTEKEIFEDVTNETVIKKFQTMSERRVHLQFFGHLNIMFLFFFLTPVQKVFGSTTAWCTNVLIE